MMARIERHFSIAEVAEALGKHQRTIRRWIQAGKLQAAKLPGRFGEEYAIPASSLNDLGINTNGVAILPIAETDRLRSALENILDAGSLEEARRLAVDALRGE